jgi:hypothetical protein
MWKDPEVNDTISFETSKRAWSQITDLEDGDDDQGDKYTTTSR